MKIKVLLVYGFLGLSCLNVNLTAFAASMNEAYLDESLRDSRWPRLTLSVSRNNYISGDKVVVYLTLENHGKFAVDLNQDLYKAVFRCCILKSKDQCQVLKPTSEEFLDFPAKLASGAIVPLAKYTFESNALAGLGPLSLQAQLLGLNLSSKPQQFEVSPYKATPH